MKLSKVFYYAILDTGYVSPEDWVKKYDQLVAGGAGLIQLRAKAETLLQTERLLARILERIAETKDRTEHPPLIINDHLSLCQKYQGLGLHLGQDDVSAQEAREKLGPEPILGLSTHSPEQFRAAIALGPSIIDYFAVGPVFATQTKPGAKAVGLELVKLVAYSEPALPFFCIGGINRGNIHSIKAAGGRRIVTVSDVLCSEDTALAVRESIASLAH